MIKNLTKDVLYAVRTLRRSPFFTIAVIVSLALGIGGNTAIFSLIDQVLLRSLPVQNPSELVILKSPGPKNGHVNSDEGEGEGSFSYPMYKDLRQKQSALAGLLARFGFDASVVSNGQTARAQGELVSGNYFDLLGVQNSIIGRCSFPTMKQRSGSTAVVVPESQLLAKDIRLLARTCWNQQIVVNGHSLTIVGITPPEFFGVQLGFNPDVFVPMTMKAEMTPNWNGLADHKDYWLNIIGRLKQGLNLQQAKAQLTAIYRPLLEAEADTMGMNGDRRAQFVGKPILLESGTAGRKILR